MMNIEVRADGARITGYVNVTEKKSRPVITPRGKVIEEIEPRAFSEAISRAGNITVTVDHDKSHIYASTDDGTVTLKEDAIGLHADVLIKDKDLIELAKKGKIRGWSFGMYNVKDSMEERATHQGAGSGSSDARCEKKPDLLRNFCGTARGRGHRTGDQSLFG